MKSVRFACAVGVALVLSACAGVEPVKVVQPLSTSAGNVMVADVDVAFSSLAVEAVAPFEEKAAAKRAAAGLAPVSTAAEMPNRPDQEEYDTLPFATMFRYMVDDVTRQYGLATGQPLRLEVEIDTLKTANAAMALLAGSNDQLAGTVRVYQAADNRKVGEFYVDVVNSHSGLLGLAARGGGVREKLSAEFAAHIAQQLGGKKKK